MNILSLVAFEAMGVVVMVIWFEEYPWDTAVMFADLIFASVWAAVVVLKFAVAYVCPSGIVIDGVTVPTVV